MNELLRFYDSEELQVDLELSGSTSSVLCCKTAESPFSSARAREELARTQPGFLPQESLCSVEPQQENVRKQPLTETGRKVGKV